MAMSEVANQFPSPNRLVHEPARLAILTVLSSCASADFQFLQGVTGLTKGNLSVQLTNLEQAGLVVITKEIVDKKTHTVVQLSQRGAHELQEYWRTMDEIRARMAEKAKTGRPPAKRLVPRPAGPGPMDWIG
jgi:DNA-binding MarR family transcriptional regulator